MAVAFLVFAAILVFWMVKTGLQERARAREARAVELVEAVEPAPARSPMAVSPPPEAHVHVPEPVPWTEAAFRVQLQHDLATLMQHAVPRSFAAGELVFHEGDEAVCACILLAGRIGLLIEAGGGRHVVVDTVRPGELFAWSGVVPPHRYTATAHAVEDSEVAFLCGQELESLCDADPVLGYHVMESIALVAGRRVRDLEVQMAGLMS